MSIQIYILSKLMEGENYPYNLMKQLSEALPFNELSSISESKLYYHFESLEKQLLIEAVKIIQETNRPDKKVYAITEKGKEELPKKIYKLFEKAGSLPDMLVGFIYVKYVDLQKVIRIIENRIDTVIEQKNQFEKIHQNFNAPKLEEKETIDAYTLYFKERINLEYVTLIKLHKQLKEK